MRDLARVLTPKRFLSIAGATLILLGLAGITGVLGEVSSASFFHPPYWINWVHFAFGFILLTVAFVGGPRVQNTFALAGAIAGTTLGSLGLLLGPYVAARLNVPELADPSDHIAHLTVGLLALWAWTNRSPPHTQRHAH